MSERPQPAPDPVPGPIFFDAVLNPHRSLGPLGFVVVMGTATSVGLTVGGWFVLHGAWPIFGFYGLDVAMLYVAFRVNYRAARLTETVRLTDRELVVCRISAAGRTDTWRFQPYWLRVSMDDPPEWESQVTLSSHGRELVVGTFLSPDERLAFAKALSRALGDWRSRPAPDEF